MAQAPRICMLGVSDPCLHARIDIAKLDGSYPPLVARRRRSRLRKRRTLSSGRRRRPPGYSSPLSPNDLTSGGKGAAESCYFEVFVSVS